MIPIYIYKYTYIHRTSCFHIFCLGRNFCLCRLFCPRSFFPPEGVLAHVAWYPMLWFDATQSIVSRALVWSSMVFQIERFPAPQKTQLVIFGNQWYGIPARFAPIPARFAPIPACDCFNEISYSARVVSFCNAHCIRLQVVSATLHTFWPPQIATRVYVAREC